MTIRYHTEADGSPLIQGSDAWRAVRCGLLTASEMKLIITPTLKIADNEKEKTHLYELLAQRVTQHVELNYVNDDMLRGKEEEIYARAAYEEHYAPVQEVGFITNDEFGFTLGCSPDGLVGTDGQIEAKSRMQKHQMKTIIECIDKGVAPDDFTIQIQTALLVTKREWCDFLTYCGGLWMATIRIYPIPEVQDAILKASAAFEKRIAEKMAKYHAITNPLKSSARLIPTERRVEQEII